MVRQTLLCSWCGAHIAIKHHFCHSRFGSLTIPRLFTQPCRLAQGRICLYLTVRLLSSTLSQPKSVYNSLENFRVRPLTGHVRLCNGHS